MKSSQDSPDIELSEAKENAANSLGTSLRAGREACNLTVLEVAKATNITSRYIQALEADDCASLPGVAFARGYVRLIAQLLKLDGDSLIAALNLLWVQQGLAGASKAASNVVGGQSKRTGTLLSAPGVSASQATGNGFGQLQDIERKPIVAQLLSWGSLLLLFVLIVGSMFWKGASVNDSVSVSDNLALDVDNPAAVTNEFPAPELTNRTQPAAPAGVAPSSARTPAANPVPSSAVAVPAVIPILNAPVTSAVPAPTTQTPALSTAATVASVSAASASSAPGVTAAGNSTGANAPAASKVVPVVVVAPNAATQAAAVSKATAVTVIPVATLDANRSSLAKVTEPTIDSLTFSFAGKSWISVRDATGQELVYGLKNEGQTVTVTGQAPFSINIGNVKVTELSRNGQPVSLKPYTRGAIASFRLTR